MIEAWNEGLGQWALPVWMTIAVLALVWLVVPPVVLRVGSRGVAPTGGWAASAALLPLAALPVLLIVPLESAPLVMLGGLSLPLLVLVGFLIARTTAPVCAECGRDLRRRWRFCPFHEHAIKGTAFGGLGSAAAVGAPLPGPALAVAGSPVAFAPPAFPVAGVAYPAAIPQYGAVGPGTYGSGFPSAPAGPSVGSISVAAGPDQGRTFAITLEGVTIGRDPASEVVLNDPAVSGRHARIVINDGRAQLIDLGSSNGTTIGGRPVDRAYVYDGDRIEIGDSILVYQELRR